MNRYLVLCANIRVLSAQIKELCAKGFMCHVSHVRCWVQKLECPVQPKGGENGSIPLVELMVFKTLGSLLYPSWWQHAAIHEKKIFGSREKVERELTLFLLFLFLRHHPDFSWFFWFHLSCLSWTVPLHSWPVYLIHPEREGWHIAFPIYFNIPIAWVIW